MDTFTFLPDSSKKQPLYLQLYAHIVGEIRSGALASGEKLPSKRALAAHLKISGNTVETAYDMLTTQGYVTAKPRSGYYVNALDGVLPEFPAQDHAQAALPAKSPGYTYDWSTNAADTSAFPYATWSKISREVLANGDGLLTLGDGRGDYCLRAAIAKYLRGFRSVRCSPAQIVVGAGMEYLISLVARLLQGTFALEDPGYPGTARRLQSLGVQTVMIPVDDGGMEETALRKSNATAAYLTPSHQFPTGAVMPVGRRMNLLAWANEKAGRYLIEDDYDSEFRYTGRPVPSMQGMDIHGKVIYIGTFSRSIAPSMRIAYMVLPEPLLSRFLTQFGSYASTVSRFEQHTLSRFIAEGHFARHVNRMRVIYRRRRDALIEAIDGLPCPKRIYGTRAGLHLLADLGTGMDAKELVEHASAQNIRIRGLYEYYRLPCPQIHQTTLVLGFAGLETPAIPGAVAALWRAISG